MLEGKFILDKQEYRKFIEAFVDSLGKTTIYSDGLGLVFYGDYFYSENFRPGIDRISGITVYPDDVVISKEKVKRLSKAIDEAQAKHPVPFNFFLTDTTTVADGRFSFVNSEKIARNLRDNKILGVRHNIAFEYALPSSKSQNRIREDLRAARSRLLLQDLYLRTGKRVSLFYSYSMSLEAAVKCPYLFMETEGNKTAPLGAFEFLISKYKGLAETREEFEKLLAAYRKRIELTKEEVGELSAQHSLDDYLRVLGTKLNGREEEFVEGSYSAVDFIEKVVKEYIKSKPN